MNERWLGKKIARALTVLALAICLSSPAAQNYVPCAGIIPQTESGVKTFSSGLS